MNKEQRVLSAIVHSKEAYDSVSALLADDFSDDVQLVVDKVKEWYTIDPEAGNVDKAWLIDSLSHDYPKMKKIFEIAVSELREVSVPNIIKEYKVLKKEKAGIELAQALLDNESDIEPYLEKYNYHFEAERYNEENEVFQNHDLDDILEAVQPDNLIKVHPASLNDRLGGGLIPGCQVAIYAPTEVGKSMLSINLAAGFMHDGRKILYCGNEDPAKMMLLRFYSRLSGMSREQLISNPAEGRTRAFNNGYGNLVFYDMSPGNIHDIKRAIERYEPEIVFVDQMANMETRAAFSKVEKNEHLATQLRSIAKKYGIVTVIVHQASDSAYGKRFVEKNDMYYSNVGVQGQMDVMIGIGMDDVLEMNSERMLCLTKNKISANHEPLLVKVQPQISRVQDI